MQADAEPRNTGRRGVWVAVVSFLALVGILAVVLVAIREPPAPDNPFDGHSLYVYPQSSAAQAAASAGDEPQAADFAKLARVPTAIWLLPEAHPTAEITAFIANIQADAAAKAQLPVFVIYGIPSRDCGNFSAGGASAQEYPQWVSAIAAGIGAAESIIILEPDALALSPSCGTQDATAALIKDAVGKLSVNPSTTIYLDAGNSHWLPPEQMAPLLTAAGVNDTRGFATNVSNYYTTAEERAYGQAVSALLGGAHYVIDTSRNGNGATGDFCNPPDRALGDTPSGVDDDTAQDASLWIKNPGESDGECNGGPPAGQWWPSQALELISGRL